MIKEEEEYRLYRTVVGVWPVTAAVGRKDCTGMSRRNGN